MATARSLRWQDFPGTTRGHGGYERAAAWALIAAVLGGLLLLTVGTAISPPTFDDVSLLTQAP